MDEYSVLNKTSAVAFGRSGRRTSIFKTPLDRPSLADFTQLGNVRGLDHGPRVLEVVWTDQTIVGLGRPLSTRPGLKEMYYITGTRSFRTINVIILLIAK